MSSVTIGASERSFPVVPDDRVHYGDATGEVAYSLVAETEDQDEK